MSKCEEVSGILTSVAHSPNPVSSAMGGEAQLGVLINVNDPVRDAVRSAVVVPIDREILLNEAQG